MKNLDKACGYRREAARNVKPGDRVFSATTRQQHEVLQTSSGPDRVFLLLDGVDLEEDYGSKELVLVAV